MIVFLTSSPTGPFGGENRRIVRGLDELNGFKDMLRARWKENARCLMIASDPENYSGNDEMTAFFAWAVQDAGMTVGAFDLWDGRQADFSRETLNSYDVVWLAGGHVPTQNAFFEKTGLRESLKGYEGMVIGISAGTMNSADEVYVQPELPGEALDPDFQRSARGLGLTWVKVLPHYQMVYDSWLDGMRLMEDITYGDSYGQEFFALPDGSFILIDPSADEGRPRLYGEAYRIADGSIRQICREGESLVLAPQAGQRE